MSRPTRADVAKLAGVAPSTVSLVLNGYAQELKLAAETVARVQDSANQLGYVPHAAARSLRSRKARLIGVFMPAIPQDSHVPVLERVVFQAIAAGHAREYTVVPVLQPLDSPAKLRSILRDIDLAGALCDVSFADHSLDVMLTSMAVPRVYLSVTETDLDPIGDGLVSIDESAGIQELHAGIDHGPNPKVAFISGPDATSGRLNALKVVAGHVIEVQVSDWSFASAEAELTNLLSSHPDITEIWCAADTFAAAACLAASRAGRDVPGEVQVIGFGDFDGGHHQGLSTVYWPLLETADLALHRVMDLIEASDEPAAERFTLPTTARFRSTTRPAR